LWTSASTTLPESEFMADFNAPVTSLRSADRAADFITAELELLVEDGLGIAKLQIWGPDWDKGFSDLLGCPPPRKGTQSASGGLTIAWLAPGEWLLIGGVATVGFGVIGSLASQDMARLAAFSVLVSSGTVLTAIGMGQVGVTGGALFYLISSTMGLGAFFLLIELVERGREAGADVLAVTREVYGEEDELEESEEVGIAIPATMGILGIAFIGCAVMISGLPPLSGFIAKFAVLTAALNPPAGAVPVSGWILLLVLILSGLAALIAMTRAGIRAFWAAPDRTVPRVRLIEIGPVAVLLLLCAIQTIQAGPVMRFMQATAQSLHAPQDYIRGVLGSAGNRPSVPGGPT